MVHTTPHSIYLLNYGVIECKLIESSCVRPYLDYNINLLFILIFLPTALIIMLFQKQQTSQSALEFCPIHCPNGRLGQDLGFGGSAFALNLPELLNRNLVAVRAKLGQTSCFPNGPQIWCPIGQ